ncbi:MAG: site-specific integrase [Lachnospiraceae bacterium]|nr:site-specific integrase [Lachnospiraceae bacterium]
MEDLTLIDANEVLKYAVECNKIDLADMQMQIERMKNQKYLEMHNHRIWQGANGKWNTYLDDESSPRGYVLKVRTTQEDIEKLVIKFYKDKEEEPYLESVFMEWNKERLTYGEISNQSYVKYLNDFKKYFTKDCILCQKKMRLITETDLEIFVKSTIKNFSMTAKTYANMRTVLRGVFTYAKKKKYTDISITTFFGDLNLSRKAFRKKVVVKEKEVFSESEKRLVTSYLSNRAKIRDLGLLLVFQTGVRVGELSALKFEDVAQNGRTLHVQRTEISYKDEEKNERICEVREYPKTEAGDRYLIIPEMTLEIIEAIRALNPHGEYMFMESGKRIRANAFNRRLDRVCDDLRIPRRSMHKIRKTYSTTLLDNDVDDSIVAEQMGHKDIATTRKSYYFCNKDSSAKYEQISKALSC